MVYARRMNTCNADRIEERMSSFVLAGLATRNQKSDGWTCLLTVQHAVCCIHGRIKTLCDFAWLVVRDMNNDLVDYRERYWVKLREAAGWIKEEVYAICSIIGVDLVDVVLRKMALNRRKHGEGLCVLMNGIAKYNKVAMGCDVSDDEITPLGLQACDVIVRDAVQVRLGFESHYDILAKEAFEFARSRGLADSHTLLGLCMLLLADAGNLAEMMHGVDAADRSCEQLDSETRDELAGGVADLVIHLLHYDRLNAVARTG